MHPADLELLCGGPPRYVLFFSAPPLVTDCCTYSTDIAGQFSCRFTSAPDCITARTQLVLYAGPLSSPASFELLIKMSSVNSGRVCGSSQRSWASLLYPYTSGLSRWQLLHSYARAPQRFLGRESHFGLQIGD